MEISMGRPSAVLKVLLVAALKVDRWEEKLEEKTVGK